MRDLPDAAELTSILTTDQLRAARDDFEAFFSSLVDEGHHELRQTIETRIYNYFDTVDIIAAPTLYDRLVLSLRRKDAIATFNWDPLLPYAYRRNGRLGNLPALLFLHGNVRMGACNAHLRVGWNDDVCGVCREPFSPVRLLYPVTRKDYSSDPVIAEQWTNLDWYLETAFIATVFGYSAPFTDVDARSRLVEHLGQNHLRRFMQVEIIDPRADELARGSLAELVADTHWNGGDNLLSSWLSHHPRLSCEGLFQAQMMNDPIPTYPMPETSDLGELQDWVTDFDSVYPQFQSEGTEKQLRRGDTGPVSPLAG